MSSGGRSASVKRRVFRHPARRRERGIDHIERGSTKRLLSSNPDLSRKPHTPGRIEGVSTLSGRARVPFNRVTSVLAELLI